MKLSKTILSIFIFSTLFFGENYSQCQNDIIEYINGNKVNAAHSNTGDFFWNRNDGKFLVPYFPGQGQDTSALFAGAIYLGGIDNMGELKTSWTNGRWYVPGPLADDPADTLENSCEKFNHIWKINRGDILWLKKDFEINGTVDLPIPASIKKWPGRGNPFFEETMGFNLPDQDLAPFFDRNNNGIFEPSNGEYPALDPSLPDAIPDEMTWCVFNNTPNYYNGYNELTTNTEIHFMTYAFTCLQDAPLNYTLFTRHKIINKSGGNLSEFKVGFWLDPDLGCYVDDFFGCDTILNTQYIYNSDNDDADSTCTGIGTYGINPPVFAVTFLNQNLSTFTYYNRGGVGNPPPGTTDPNTRFEFYNYLTGRWKDGTPFTSGGNGYNPNGPLISHVFTDPPSDPNGWNLINLQLPFADRLTIMSAGSFDFLNGDEIMLDAAFSWHRNYQLNHLENADLMFEQVPLVKEFYNSGFINNCGQADFCENDCVWPGDANHDGIANNEDLLYLGLAMGKNATGPARNPATHVWSPYISDDWDLFPNNDLNQKNQDCNGDGKVDEKDWYILENNYNARRPDFNLNKFRAPYSENELFIDLNKDVIPADSSLTGRRFFPSVFLANQDQPIPEIYGIAFSMRFDKNVFGLWADAVSTQSPNTFFGTEEEILSIRRKSHEEGFIDFAISRKDGQPVQNAFGPVDKLIMIVKENAATGNFDGRDTIRFQLFDAMAVDADGNFFELGAYSDSIIVTNMVYDSTLNIVEDSFIMEDSLVINDPPFIVAPNPTNGTFDIFFEKISVDSKIDFYDFSGNKILSEKIAPNTEKHSINLSGELPPGIYFVKWTQPDGTHDTRPVLVN